MPFNRVILLLISILVIGCKGSGAEYANEAAPATFTATFETTKGDFDIEVKKSLSPKAADRFYNLIKSGYYNNSIFYRVVPNFVAQFGHTDPAKMEAWKNAKVPDEVVQQGNTRGAITFARAGVQSRGLDLFINLQDNPSLDTLDYEGVIGFPSFGHVTNGMDVVDQLFSGYGERTMEDPAVLSDPDKLIKAYPRLDIIRRAYITPGK